MKLRYVLVGIVAVLVAGFVALNYFVPPQRDGENEGAIQMPQESPVYRNDTGLIIPEDFSIVTYANDLPSVRVLAFDDQGTLLASLMKEGKVVALPDENNDNRADDTEVLLEGLNEPHGLLVVCNPTQNPCTLYVAETDALYAYPYTSGTREIGEPIRLVDLPDDGGHSTRTLHLHPDGTQILISVGSKCNACIEDDPRRATVMTYDIATGEIGTFASGLRNAVFMTTDPETGYIWGTDNGRDQLGDDIPPDEVNILSLGDNFGWPYCYGKNIPDVTQGASVVSCAESIPSHIDIQAHSAPLGLAFVPEEGWPEAMQNDLLVAYHGSWNRTIPTGYKVVRFDLSADSRNALGEPSEFLGGFIEEGASEDTAIGRPVAVVALPGGVVYISDDARGMIYKMEYHGDDQ